VFDHFLLALEHPKAAVNYLRRRGLMYKTLGIDEDVVRNEYNELFRKEIWDKLRDKIGVDLQRARLRQAELYIICKVVRPKVVVETGVQHGISTTFILQALKDNGSGRLYSIDLPNVGEAPLPLGKQSGWLIPDKLKDSWTLRLGRSIDILPEVLKHLEEIEIFLHDSEHTYNTMMAEYRLAWPHLRPEGLLLSDDTGRNEAFLDFAKEVNHQPKWTIRGYGLLKR